MTPMIIRTFRLDDSEALLALWQNCNLIASQNDPHEDIARKLTVQPELFLVGELGGEIIASVMGGYEGHRGWLNYLAVSPAHRRQGYGKTIVAEAERLICEKGAPKINLQVRTTNTEVLEFYRSMGYRVDDVISLGKRLVID
jgi:ribosomal protein S18 acetylase RimI-like enzyme